MRPENKSRIVGVLQNKDESLYPRANKTKETKITLQLLGKWTGETAMEKNILKGTENNGLRRKLMFGLEQ